MRVVLQRVHEARVEVEGKVTGSIQRGILALVGVAASDSEAEAATLADKTLSLRIFPDEHGKMNRSLLDIGGSLLVVSQFTLYGDCRKGRRPSFDAAAPAAQARSLYEHFVQAARAGGVHVETGIFQAYMSVHLVNDGPVTLILEND